MRRCHRFGDSGGIERFFFGGEHRPLSNNFRSRDQPSGTRPQALKESLVLRGHNGIRLLMCLPQGLFDSLSSYTVAFSYSQKNAVCGLDAEVALESVTIWS